MIKAIFAAIIRLIYNLVGQNYGLAIILFTIITKLILFPLNYKQAKSMNELKKIAPLEKNIREKYKGNNEKMSEELMKLYKDNKINPYGGCLPLLIQLPIIIAMFWIVKQPLTYIVQVPQEDLKSYAQEYLQKEDVTEKEIKNVEIEIAKKYDLLDMDFCGLNFGDVPSESLKKDEKGATSVSKWTLLVPIFSIVLGFVQTKISQKSNNMTEEQMQQQKTMNFMMPILLGYTAYIMPVALGVYWLLGNILGIISQLLINFMLKDRKILIGEGEKK